MKIVPFKIQLEDDINGIEILKKIEKAGRTCYKSEENISEESSIAFIKKILESGHESVIEHEKVTIRVICDRGVTHEIVRHRIASYSQESTRYCNYSKEKNNSEITVIDIKKHLKNEQSFDIWIKALYFAEIAYMKLLSLGETPQIARSVLPNSLKTEIVITMNLREWRHFLKLRCSKAAHPQMREVAIEIGKQLKEKIPVMFDEFDLSN